MLTSGGRWTIPRRRSVGSWAMSWTRGAPQRKQTGEDSASHQLQRAHSRRRLTLTEARVSSWDCGGGALASGPSNHSIMLARMEAAVGGRPLKLEGWAGADAGAFFLVLLLDLRLEPDEGLRGVMLFFALVHLALEAREHVFGLNVAGEAAHLLVFGAHAEVGELGEELVVEVGVGLGAVIVLDFGA